MVQGQRLRGGCNLRDRACIWNTNQRHRLRIRTPKELSHLREEKKGNIQECKVSIESPNILGQGFEVNIMLDLKQSFFAKTTPNYNSRIFAINLCLSETLRQVRNTLKCHEILRHIKVCIL